MKAVGSGRIFDGAFMDVPALRAVQECARPLVAAAMAVLAEDLVWQPERCAVKPEGCPALVAHVDGGHSADFQATHNHKTCASFDDFIGFAVGGTTWQ